MSYEILQHIDETRSLIPANLKPAIIGHVTQAARNHAEITGRKRNAKFFYREAEPDDLRRGLMQRTSELYFSFALASPLSGELIEREFASWFEARRQMQGYLPDVRDIWTLQEETDALLNVLRSAVVKANRIEARATLIKMRRNIDQMLRQCDTEIPSPFSTGVLK